jgi:deoxyribodipyrimidine photo-lyase
MARAGAGRVNALWLRVDLRLDDNPALLAACERADSMLPIFVFDPAKFKTQTLGGSWKSSARRARFLLESVACMRKKLENKGSGLAVVLGKASEAVPRLAGRCNDVFVTQGVCSEETIEENKVEKNLKTNQVKLNRIWGNTLFFPNECGCNTGKGKEELPLLFTSFKNKAESKGKIRNPLHPPVNIPPVPEQTEFKGALSFMPSLQELGYSSEEADDAMKDDPRGVMTFVGGEDAALERVQNWIFRDDQLKHYFEIRNGMVGEGYSSKFSPWLALGCISPRRVWAEAQRYEQERVKNKSTYWLIFELTWRDFYLYMGNSYGDKIFVPGGITGQNQRWSGGEAELKRWKEGRTGDKLVDANMRELAATGFMSNRGRQNVASYLIFDLGVDWRFGAAHFEEHLLDHDPCSNWGNWLAAAGLTGQRINKFNTKKQLNDYDPNREYVDLWLKGSGGNSREATPSRVVSMNYDNDASNKNQKGGGKGKGKRKEYNGGYQEDRKTRRWAKQDAGYY